MTRLRVEIIDGHSFDVWRSKIQEVEQRLTAANHALESAEHQAEAIIAQANFDADIIREEIRQAAKNSLGKFVDEKTVEATSTAIRRCLLTSAKIQKDFDDLRPWLRACLLASLERILGAIEPDDLLDGVITNTLDAQGERWTFDILACGSETADIERIVRSNPRIQDRIKQVVSHDNLAAGTMILRNDNGNIDISLSTFVRSFEDLIAEMEAEMSARGFDDR